MTVPTLEINENRPQVLEFLCRLTSTAEYQNGQTRSHLAKRIMAVLQAMEEKEEIKGRAVDLMYQGVTTCDDRIIAALDEIELMIHLHEIENSSTYTEDQLRELGKSFLLLEMVHQKSKAFINTLTWVDEVEVYLAFQIGLADRLNLPIRTRNMIFTGCSQVKAEDILRLGNELEQACTQECLEVFLATWSPWVIHQRRQAVPLYESLKEGRALQKDETCSITQNNPEKPVFYAGQVYDYDAFVKWYAAKGTDPFTRLTIDLSQLSRITC